MVRIPVRAIVDVMNNTSVVAAVLVRVLDALLLIEPELVLTGAVIEASMLVVVDFVPFAATVMAVDENVVEERAEPLLLVGLAEVVETAALVPGEIVTLIGDVLTAAVVKDNEFVLLAEPTDVIETTVPVVVDDVPFCNAIVVPAPTVDVNDAMPVESAELINISMFVVLGAVPFVVVGVPGVTVVIRYAGSVLLVGRTDVVETSTLVVVELIALIVELALSIGPADVVTSAVTIVRALLTANATVDGATVAMESGACV